MRLAVAQLTGEPFAVEENRTLTVRATREAFEQGADLVLLPELVVPGYIADRRLAEVAEPLLGETFEAWRGIAAQAGGVVVGGFCERDGDALYNTAIAVSGDGLLLHYRKVHLFSEEKLVFRPGDRGFPVAPTPVGRLGVCICYDLRFVEVVRLLALAGADLVCVPTAWLTGFDQVRWDEKGLCPQANGAIVQANLSQVFIACASQAGLRGTQEFLGSSVVVDPHGKLVLGPLSGTADALKVADIDLEEARRAQARSPLISPRADRRTDVYGIWTASGEVL